MVPECQSQGQGNSSPLPSPSRSITPLPPDAATSASSATMGRDGSIDSLAMNDTITTTNNNNSNNNSSTTTTNNNNTFSNNNNTTTSSTTTTNSSSSNGRVLYSFVRKRSCGGFAAFGLTTVKQLESGQRVELKQVITKQPYTSTMRCTTMRVALIHLRHHETTFLVNTNHILLPSDTPLPRPPPLPLFLSLISLVSGHHPPHVQHVSSWFRRQIESRGSTATLLLFVQSTSHASARIPLPQGAVLMTPICLSTPYSHCRR